MANYCTDCTHMRKECGGLGMYPTCRTAPEPKHFDKVTGQRLGFKFKYCTHVRTDLEECPLYKPSHTAWIRQLLRGVYVSLPEPLRL